MALRDLLKRDIVRRRELIAKSQELIKHWEDEIAKLPKHPPPIAHHLPLPRAGIDFAYGRPLPARLRAAGVTFVARYLGGSPDKDLDAHEVENYSAAGLDIVTVWESTATRAADGYVAGAEDARAALRQLHQIGAPSHAVVYFAVDFDAEASQIEAYFNGAKDVLGHARVGVYAGIRIVGHLLANGVCRYGWQTYAWSGGDWSSRAQLRQVQNGITIAGVEADRDEAVAADFGQWRI